MARYISREAQLKRNVYWPWPPVCVCLQGPYSSVGMQRGTDTLLHGPRCNLGEWQGVPSGCALLEGFAIGERLSLL